MDISIIVPIYKIEKNLLTDCIDSLCKQTYKNIEIVLVDDGSPDECGQICDEYGSHDNRIKVIHTENKGVSNARNEGIRNSSGRYIMFVDGDDFLELDTCERCMEKMKATNADLLLFKVCKDKSMTDNSEKNDILLTDKDSIEKVQLSVMTHVEPYPGYISGSPCMKLYKRDIIVDNGLQFVVGLKKCQDRVFTFDYYSKIHSVVFLDYQGYHYVLNENSVTNKYNPNIDAILRKAREEFDKRINKNNEQFQQAYDILCVRFLGEILHLDILNPKNSMSLTKKANRIKILIKDRDYIHSIKYANLKLCGKKNALIFFLIRFRMVFFATYIGSILYKS